MHYMISNGATLYFEIFVHQSVYYKQYREYMNLLDTIQAKLLKFQLKILFTSEQFIGLLDYRNCPFLKNHLSGRILNEHICTLQ